MRHLDLILGATLTLAAGITAVALTLNGYDPITIGAALFAALVGLTIAHNATEG